MKNKQRKIRKYDALFLLLLLTITILLAGCKIETPEEVRRTSKIEVEREDNESIQETGESAVQSKEENNPIDQYIGIEDISDSPEDLSKYENNSDSNSQDNQTSKEINSEEHSTNSSNWNHDNDRANLEFKDEDKDGRDDATGLDQYLTDPIPEGKPHPVEAQDATIDTKKIEYCTLSIRCDTILENKDDLDEELKYLLEKDGIKDGIIFPKQKVAFYEGESVFDVLLRETKTAGIHMEFSFTPMYNSHYIEGIHNFYEFSCGELSGWMYRVNGWFPNYGCSRYQLKEGDVIEWVYTCDLGRDVGCDWLGGS